MDSIFCNTVQLSNYCADRCFNCSPSKRFISNLSFRLNNEPPVRACYQGKYTFHNQGREGKVHRDAVL